MFHFTRYKGTGYWLDEQVFPNGPAGNDSIVLSMFLPTDLLKANFFARPIFPFKSFAQTKWPKNQHKN